MYSLSRCLINRSTHLLQFLIIWAASEHVYDNNDSLSYKYSINRWYNPTGTDVIDNNDYCVIAGNE